MGWDGDPINASIMTHSTLHTGAKIISTTKIWLFPACLELSGLTDCIPAPVFYRRLQIPNIVVNILINSTQSHRINMQCLEQKYTIASQILGLWWQALDWICLCSQLDKCSAINNLDHLLSQVTNNTTQQLSWSKAWPKKLERSSLLPGGQIWSGIKEISETGTNIIYYFHYQKNIGLVIIGFTLDLFSNPWRQSWW